jgi:hypothetical protein
MPRSAQLALEAGSQMLADNLVRGLVDNDLAGQERLRRAVARHLVDFWTWRSLVALQGLGDREAVTIAVRLLASAWTGATGTAEG